MPNHKYGFRNLSSAALLYNKQFDGPFVNTMSNMRKYYYLQER